LEQFKRERGLKSKLSEIIILADQERRRALEAFERTALVFSLPLSARLRSCSGVGAIWR
jgi:hypothetical protein